MSKHRFTGSNKTSSGIPSSFDSGSRSGFSMPNGVFVAKVVESADGDFGQAVYVEIVGHHRFGDRDTREQRQHFPKVRTVSPFGGTVSGKNSTVTYGATFHPPAPGTEVLVAFTGNDVVGFLLGVLPSTGRNSALPGLPASQVDAQSVGSSLDPGVGAQDQNIRPRHPVANAIAEQGLGLDPIRGISSSGARRESPSNVSGFLTPGGHSFTMDDGTVALKEGENYVPDNNREEGLDNLVRLRSAGGAQMLFNDSAGIVYITNQKGASWIQLDSDGNVDVYAAGSISYHAEEDFNFYAGGDINMDADTFNIKARGAAGIQAETVTGPIQLKANKDIRLTTDLNLQLKAAGFGRISTDGMLDLNGPQALGAVGPTSGSLSVNRSVKESINPRVPEHEPWGGHSAQGSKVAAQAPASVRTTAKDYDMSKISDTLNTPVAANIQGTRRKLTDQTVIYTDNTEADTGNWKPPARDKREGL
jgi:hypothetical protein|tara:strand:+ start:6759 stop:8183 length:1425 start_codon:yes stop_codon:yes gene_type:complete